MGNCWSSIQPCSPLCQDPDSKRLTDVKCVSSYSMKKRITLVYRLSLCNIIAEGLQFMPLGLVRLRTFRLTTWVS